jgi:segregation and condensation protein A
MAEIDYSSIIMESTAKDLTEEPKQEVEKELDGIEILVNMAKTGKVDPWNIDIVDITDKYLAHMFQMKAQNLRLTGRTLLFAAVLLRLKSNVLENVDINEFDQDEQQFEDGYDINDDYRDDEDTFSTNNVVSIDEALQRRTSVRLNRSRVVTLKDLIRQLEFYEMIDKKQSLKNAHERAKRRVRSYANLTADDIINIAHDEYIEEGVEKLKQNLEQIFNHQEKIELNELTLLGMDRTAAYISLLFLCVEQSGYDLYQEEFYSDLYVVKTSENENSQEEIA